MRRFFVLVRKELKELVTAQMLLPLALVIIMFVLLGNVLEGEMDRGREAQPIGVADLDGSVLSAQLTDALSQGNFEVVALEGVDEDTMAAELAERDLSYGVIVPAGFEAAVQRGASASVDTYGVVRSFSLNSLGQAETLNAVVGAVNDAMSSRLIAEGMPGSNPAVVKQPVANVEHVIVGDAEAQASVESVYGFITSQTTFIPIVLFIVIIFAAQMIATTIASEKENKTLETMLASPVSRTALVMSKMVAAGTVALVSAGAYMIGLRSYLGGMSGDEAGPFQSPQGATSAIQELGLGLGSVDWALLGATLFMAILIALAIAVILGAFAENVKAVQSLIAPLMILVLIPYFLTLLSDIQSASPALRAFVLAIPFTHAFMAAPNLYLDQHQQVLLGIGYQAIWLAVLVLAAARIFASDRILTMKLSLRRSR